MITSKTGTGESSPLVVDHFQNPFNAGLAVVVSGTVTYTVQYTLDDVLDPAVTATWFSHATLAAQSATAAGSQVTPVRAFRLTNTAGTGSTTLTVLQSGVPGR